MEHGLKDGVQNEWGVGVMCMAWMNQEEMIHE